MGAKAPMPLPVCGRRRRCAMAQGRGMLQAGLVAMVAETRWWGYVAPLAVPAFAACGGLTKRTTRFSARREAPPTNKLNNSGDSRVWPAKG